MMAPADRVPPAVVAHDKWMQDLQAIFDAEDAAEEEQYEDEDDQEEEYEEENSPTA